MSSRRAVSGSAMVLLLAVAGVTEPAVLFAGCPDFLGTLSVDGVGPKAVTVDVNADGATDIVSVMSGGLSVVISNGDGTFAAPVEYPMTDPRDLVAGDFDGDGNIDIAATSGASGVAVFIGDGLGAFGAPVHYAAGGTPSELAAADFDDDGDLDLAVTTSAPDGVAILAGVGDGTFGSPVGYSAGSGLSRIAAADFNGDGIEDLAVSTSSGVAVLTGLGGGTFSAPSLVPMSSANELAVADFDADGFADFAQAAGAVTVFYGNADGTFERRPVALEQALAAGAFAFDLNGDGKADLASAWSDRSVLILLGRGNGTFQPARYYANPHDEAGLPVASADFNADGKGDVIIALSGGTRILLGAGDGSLGRDDSFRVGIYQNHAIAADFDGDGDADLAIMHDTGPAATFVTVALGDGRGGMSVPASLPYITDGGVDGIAAADLSGDGKPDLIIGGFPTTSVGTVGVMIGDGGGGFANETRYPTLLTNVVGVKTADFNGDGKADVLAHGALGNSSVSILLGNGDGTLQAPRLVAVAANTFAAVVGDFNHDGKLDIVASAITGGSTYLLLGNGDATFGAPVPIGPVGTPLAAHLNGDANLDLVLFLSGSAMVLLGNGSGGFTSSGSYPLAGDAYAVAAGDLNNDGHLDLVAVSGPADVVLPHSILYGNGDGTFRPVVPFSGRYEGRDVVLADFNTDGRLDLLVVQLNSINTATMLLNSIARAPIAAPSSVAIASTGNVGSVPDHPGSTYAWSLTGGVITSGQGTSTVQFDAGPAGTRMTLSVTETTATGCASGTANVMVDFNDVPPTHLFHNFITQLALAGVTGGCGTGNYCVNDPVLRSQMAVFLLRGEHGASFAPPPATGIFADVAVPSFFADFIERLYAEGITGGCAINPLRYCPSAPVTRSQMAIFLLRAKYGSSYVPPPATGIFADVPVGSFGADFIERLYSEAITGGCATNPLRYCPLSSTTRGAMAVFLTRTFNLP